ncbi:MAG: InlB B-repeat-containing protein [Clostridia bacterium]|nr:InlB B-repeat-containing protein [Clostridia bacterium]
MKKVYALAAVMALCLLLAACTAANGGILFTPTVNDRMNAVVDIDNIERSTIEVTDGTNVTVPQYFEVIAASTTASTTAASLSPQNTEQSSSDKTPSSEETTTATEPTVSEYYMVKFVDYDGYSMISVQNVAEGSAANEPPMPERRGDLIFRGWDKDFSNIRQSMIVKAIYQKEWLTVRFYDAGGKLLKTEQVAYGESATPPEITAPDGYIFSGWSRAYDNITRDTNVYATYEISPKSNAITLIDAYKLLTVVENTTELSSKNYSRASYDGICTIDGEDYGGNILYGNFSDRLELSGYGFTTLEGSVGLKTLSSNVNNTEYSLTVLIFVNGLLKFETTVSETGTMKNFSVDLTNAETVTVRLATYVDGERYTGTDFFGGIIDAIIY